MTNNKPDWKDVPDGVTHIAQDGTWWGFSGEPYSIFGGRWFHDTDRGIQLTPPHNLWNTTLEKRPND